MTPITLGTVVAIVAFALYKFFTSARRDPRMPPGPPTLPIIGNLHLIPQHNLHRKFRDWQQQYGGIYSLKFGNKNVIVLCDRKAIHDLVDKKGLLYADRPDSYVGQLLTQGDHMVLSSNDPITREKRRTLTHNFSPKMIDEKHTYVQEPEIRQLMLDCLTNGSEFYDHVHRTTSSIACSVIFGHRGPTYENFWGHCVYEALTVFGECLEPGANPPVDEFPFLKLWPTVISPWKQKALKSAEFMDGVWSKARAIVEERRRNGDKRDCIADHLLDEYTKKGFPMTQHAFENLLGEMVEGGAETTSSSMSTHVLAIANDPKILKEAQRQIDLVCGPDRSPTWDDFKKIPYINQIVKEGMRFRPVISSGLPHRNHTEDTYEGYLIPKDSMIFLPVWALHHSENQGFKNPEHFDPDRYANHPRLANDYAGSPDYNQRDHYGYGAGRRMCPGIHFAERNQWRMLAKLLWAFDVSDPKFYGTEKHMPLNDTAYAEQLLHAPMKYTVNLKPRSAAHAATIRREFDELKHNMDKYN
ncbi:MAG: hypothetical protein M1819_006974 [Sarea resinae]|nr:MAG: hypothetical protein M1819_006974 [Sarea resinae]